MPPEAGISPDATRRAQDDPLWAAIAAFPLDDPDAALSFSARLARDHAWTDSYAARVVEEYRRFLYLVATSPVMVTPSEDVDEAWHLHLSYTRSYWDQLCGRIVGRPLHHDPTDGGDADTLRFREAYERTLARYSSVFGAMPPADVWPDAEARFSVADGYRTVRLHDYWIVRRLWSARVGQGLSVVGGFAAFLGGGFAGFGLFPTMPFMGTVVGLGSFAAYEFALQQLSGKPGSLILAVNPGGSGVTVQSGCGGCGGCGG